MNPVAQGARREIGTANCSYSSNQRTKAETSNGAQRHILRWHPKVPGTNQVFHVAHSWDGIQVSMSRVVGSQCDVMIELW
jgi:hypothetical protein